ncbi:MAG: MFS transporter [Elusimicrobia bacterium]|nr:MFS transporter [Elusimicrobiota bacterium]
MTATIKKFFAPAPHKELLCAEEIRRLYPRYRFSILESTFIGYAAFYLVRNNLSTVAKDMEQALNYSHSMVGNFLAATAVAYGLGKFVMGAFSDRSNPRVFMPLGLILTAACNFIFGSSTSYPVHLFLWALNGFIQGMGWPPCGRSLAHWFGIRERGTIFSIWNIAHNVGGGLAGIIAAFAAARWGWQYAFYFPGFIALISALYLIVRLRDTPQSVGLPAIEQYKNDYPAQNKDAGEQELSTRELLGDYILKNKLLWLFASANFFVYIVRYSMLDWGPIYLREVKGAGLAGGGLAVMALEFGGIPSTIFMGWLSDRLGGRRGLVSLLCMIPILLAFAGIIANPAGRLWLDTALLGVVGFFVYPPVMLLGVAALDITSKKAVGAAAGFVGLFGYLGRTAQAKAFGWMAEHFGRLYGPAIGWKIVLYCILGAAVVSIILLAFTWRVKPRD